MSKEVGDPHVNLCMAVLASAAVTKSCLMWQSFKKSDFINNTNVDPWEAAKWVGGYWQEFFEPIGTKKVCTNCKITTYAEINVCDICRKPLKEVK